MTTVIKPKAKSRNHGSDKPGAIWQAKIQLPLISSCASANTNHQASQVFPPTVLSQLFCSRILVSHLFHQETPSVRNQEVFRNRMRRSNGVFRGYVNRRIRRCSYTALSHAPGLHAGFWIGLKPINPNKHAINQRMGWIRASELPVFDGLYLHAHLVLFEKSLEIFLGVCIFSQQLLDF